MKTLIEKSICFNTPRNISIENANFKLLQEKLISFKYKFKEDEVENEGVIDLKIPKEENSAIKDFIIWKINNKLSEFVEEKNDIFVPDSELAAKEEEKNEFDATQFFTKL